ncbi:hypothetical protein A9762_13210 [Pandoraea sp. ISTKB]|nr:hypothetical protein A9762_13210 [Pandoraea sp. ISTKB]
MQGLGAKYASAAFRMGRPGPVVKLRTHARPGPQGKEESHENTREWILLMILIVGGRSGEFQPDKRQWIGAMDCAGVVQAPENFRRGNAVRGAARTSRHAISVAQASYWPQISSSKYPG